MIYIYIFIHIYILYIYIYTYVYNPTKACVKACQNCFPCHPIGHTFSLRNSLIQCSVAVLAASCFLSSTWHLPTINGKKTWASAAVGCPRQYLQIIAEGNGLSHWQAYNHHLRDPNVMYQMTLHSRNIYTPLQSINVWIVRFLLQNMQLSCIHSPFICTTFYFLSS